MSEEIKKIEGNTDETEVAASKISAFWQKVKGFFSKLWAARHKIALAIAGACGIAATSYLKGRMDVADEREAELDRRLETLSLLSGIEAEHAETLEQAQDLVETFGDKGVRKAFEDPAFWDKAAEESDVDI